MRSFLTMQRKMQKTMQRGMRLPMKLLYQMSLSAMVTAIP
jgi:hypothetical protein